MQLAISLPDQPVITEKDSNTALFVIEKCAPGYGLTLGNAFRRALLSSIPGAAITSVRIAGADHEFSTIDHVKEDVIQILLNLKGVALHVVGDDVEEPLRGSVKATGNKTTDKMITAGDINFPSEVEVANPDHGIVTITGAKGKIDMEVEVERGMGYVPVEKRTSEKLPVGTLALDAVFSPIRRVSYDVENMRVGDRTDFNRLRIEIETDGSMSPKEAFERASKILVDHFYVFLSPQDLEELEEEAATEEEMAEPEVLEEREEKKEAEPETEPEEEDPRLRTIEEVGLPTRIMTILQDAGLLTVGEVAKHTEEELLDIEGMGEASVKEIKRTIGRLGVTLRR